MLRALIYGLSILHLGPGIAFALLAFGCEGPTPYLVAVCGRSGLLSFAFLTAGSWLLLVVGLAALHLLRLARNQVQPSVRLRICALLLVAGTGALLGASGAWLTGSQYWFLAIPVALACAWLLVANLATCQPTPGSDGNASAGTNGAA